MSAEQMDRLLSCVEECFPVRELEEFTVEAGRPDTITPEKLAVMRAHGVNRVSVNPQSFNDEVLALSQRPHTAAQAIEAFQMAKDAGFEVVNMDFIAGLPGDTLDSFRHSLDTAIAFHQGILPSTPSPSNAVRAALCAAAIPISPADRCRWGRWWNMLTTR